MKENNQSFWDFYFHFRGGEADELMRLLIWKNISFDKEQFAPEKLAVIVMGEAAKTGHKFRKF